MKYLLVLILSSGIAYSYAQKKQQLEGKMDYLESSVDPSGTLDEISLRPPDYKGSIHLDEEFVPGKIHLNSGVVNVELRFNLREEIVEARRNNKFYSVPFHKIMNVVLADSTVYQVVKGDISKLLYQDEEVALFKKFTLYLKESTYDPRLNIGNPDHQYKIDEQYLIKINQEIFPLDKRKHVKNIFREFHLEGKPKNYRPINDAVLIDFAKTVSESL